MNPTTDEPVITAQLIATIVQVVTLLMAFGVIHLTPDQFHLAEQVISGGVTLLAPVVAAWFARSQVTPVAKAEAQAQAAYHAGERNATRARQA